MSEMLPTSTQDVIHALDESNDISMWINSALSAGTDDGLNGSLNLSVLEQKVAGLVGAVDIACEDTSLQLERIIDDASRGIPRLTYDLHFLKDDSLSLQTALATVSSKSSAMPESTALVLERLQFLDTVKGRMEAAREVLREAESWSTLESEVTSLLAEQSYAKAAERLSEASRSMVIFENTAEYESRRALMVNLQNLLEASLSSALVAAITAQDFAVCREFYSIFCHIQRESEFRNYYNGSKKTPLVAMWQNVLLIDGDIDPAGSTSASQTLADFLPKFYASFLSLLEAERACVPFIFPDPHATLSTLITSILSTLQPTFSQRLTSLFDYHGAAALREVITAYQATEEFATNAEKTMERIKFASTVSPRDSPKLDGPQQHARRRSTRMSVSWLKRSSLSGPTSFHAPRDVEWDQELFQPFLDLQTDYGSLERRLLDDSLAELFPTGRVPEGSDKVRLLKEQSVDICRVAEEAISRCMQLTHGYAAVGLVCTLDNLFKSFMDTWTASIKAASASNRSAPPSAAEDGVSDLDYTEQDWADFQLSIHLLGAARTVFFQLTALEAKLRTRLMQISTTFRMARNDPFNFSLLGVTNGAGELLIQSTLNSAELHTLLTNVDPETSVRQPNTGAAVPILVDARNAVSSFSRTCQTSLQDTILSPLYRHLTSYASSPLWSAPGDPKSRRIAANDLQVPSFSLSPTDIVQRVAEGILNLPRLFEVYADDDALSFSLQTLPYIDGDLVKGLSEQHDALPSHARRASLTTRTSALISPVAVSAAWLSSLGHSILSHFTSSVIPDVRSLSHAGAAQLATDLEYLSNIVRALNVEHEDLERWKEAVEMEEEELRGKRAVERDSLSDIVLGHVARMRGWRF